MEFEHITRLSLFRNNLRILGFKDSHMITETFYLTLKTTLSLSFMFSTHKQTMSTMTLRSSVQKATTSAKQKHLQLFFVSQTSKAAGR